MKKKRIIKPVKPLAIIKDDSLFIFLTRIAPRALDFDNLVYAFKHIRDVIADTLLPGLAAGRADDDKRLQWQYCQEKGRPKEYAFRISIKRL